MERKQKILILKDLEKKMVFLVGPRQVGKTWLAKDIGKSFINTVYLNYDSLEDRKLIEDETWLKSTDFLILDELHKKPDWKNYLKGIYDTKEEHLKILVTGSARLEAFNQVGDSLAGRFYSHRLLPFSPSELKLFNLNLANDIDRFIERGGFPEPFLANNSIDANRWRMQYINGLIRTDILDFDNIHNLKAVQLVLELLKNKVGSTISYNSIAEDVGISPNTVKKYVQIFEALFIVFRVTPYTKNIARSLLKEPKIYFFDTGMVNGSIGARLENLIAICLLKYIYGKIDYKGESYALRYIRTKEGREVDFVLIHNGNVEKIIEVKHTNKHLSDSLIWFSEKYNFPAVQVVKELKHERFEKGIIVKTATNFLKELDF